MQAVLAYLIIFTLKTPPFFRQASQTERVYRTFVKRTFLVNQLMNFCCAMGAPVAFSTNFGFPPTLGFLGTEDLVDRLWGQFAKIERVRFTSVERLGETEWKIEPDGPGYYWPTDGRKHADVQMPKRLYREVFRHIAPLEAAPRDFVVKSIRCFVRPYWSSELRRWTLVSGFASVKEHGVAKTLEVWFLLPADYSVAERAAPSTTNGAMRGFAKGFLATRAMNRPDGKRAQASAV